MRIRLALTLDFDRRRDDGREELRETEAYSVTERDPFPTGLVGFQPAESSLERRRA